MYNFPIGVVLESFRLPTYEAVKKASELGIKGIQIYATEGNNAPENLSGTKARDLLNHVKNYGLVFSALCGDMGHGFGNAEMNPKLIARSKRILELAKELECNIVTTHIGVVPSNPAHERYKIMQEACAELAEYADALDAHFAIETGPEPSDVLKNFLDSLGSKGVAVNLDPANLAMVVADDAVHAVHTLKDYIVHTHAKDGRMLVKGNPEFIYRVVHPVPEEIEGIKYAEELPLGTGDVCFPEYLRALEDIGYRGYLTIEREVGNNPAADIGIAVDYLHSIINKQ